MSNKYLEKIAVAKWKTGAIAASKIRTVTDRFGTGVEVSSKHGKVLVGKPGDTATKNTISNRMLKSYLGYGEPLGTSTKNTVLGLQSLKKMYNQ